MKYVIHKHHLAWDNDPQEIETPIGSRVVHVGIQYERPTVWVEREVSPYADHHMYKMRIKIMATGEEFERTRTDDRNEAIHLGTVQHQPDRDSDFETVWHFYQVKEG